MQSIVAETLTSVAESLQPVVFSEGVLVYGVGGVLVLIAVASVVSWWRTRNREPASFGEPLDDETIERGDAKRAVFDELAERQQDVMAPSAIRGREKASARNRTSFGRSRPIWIGSV